MESLFCCPLCRAPLQREERRYFCPNRHSFDRAAAGYVHLLPANKLHSRDPGDDKGMAAARSRFLDGGYYAPLRQALTKLALDNAPPSPAVVDAGCGEGYYTAALYEALSEKDAGVRLAGVDLSKHALRTAAKRERRAEFAVASVYGLPVGDAAADLLVDCFSPLAAEEFFRVLKPGGLFLYVVPGPRHLWELKQVLYDTPYENPEKLTPYPGFQYRQVEKVEYSAALPDRETVLELFQMTPYFWKTPKSGTDRLQTLTGLTVTASFRIHVFQKTETGGMAP